VVRHGARQRAQTLSLAQMMARFNTSWLDYLKIDCESCEFAALAQFLDEATAGGGTVPVTQIQMEVHVPGRSLAKTRAWAKYGINHTSPMWPELGPRANAQALRLLAQLLDLGFVVFHIGLGGAHRFQCCGAEYSLINTRAPAERLGRPRS